jgi:hypothetical protein
MSLSNDAAMRQASQKYIESFSINTGSAPFRFISQVNVPQSTFSSDTETYTTSVASTPATSDDTWLVLDNKQEVTVSMTSTAPSSDPSASVKNYESGFSISLPLYLSAGTSSDSVLLAGQIQGSSQMQYIQLTMNTTLGQLKAQWNNQNIVYSIQQTVLGTPILVTITYRDISYANASASDVPLGLALYLNGSILQPATSLPSSTSAIIPLLSASPANAILFMTLNRNKDFMGAMGPLILNDSPYTKDQVAALFVGLQSQLFKQALPAGSGSASVTATPLATAANPLVVSLSDDTLASLQSFLGAVEASPASVPASTPIPSSSLSSTSVAKSNCPFDDQTVCGTAQGCSAFDWSQFPHNAMHMPKDCRSSLNEYCIQNSTDSFCSYLSQLKEQQDKEKAPSTKKSHAHHEGFTCRSQPYSTKGPKPRPSSVWR